MQIDMMQSVLCFDVGTVDRQQIHAYGHPAWPLPSVDGADSPFTRRVGTAAKKFHFTQPLDKDVRFTLHLEANHGADCSLRLQMGEVDVRTGQRKFYTVRPFRLPLYCEWPRLVTLLRPFSCRCLL